MSQPRDVFLGILSKSLFLSLTPHELSEDVIPTAAMESNQVAADPATTAVELAHQLAFRHGLGNSLFASPLEPVTLTAVRALYRQARAGQVALIGTGIEFNKLKAAAEPFFGDELEIALAGRDGKNVPVEAAPAPAKTKYYGGEERQALDLHHLDTPGVAPTLVIAYGSTEASSPKTVLENIVLSHLIGTTTTPSIKRVAGTGPLATAVASVEGASASSFVGTYSDASLLVVEVQAPGSKRLSEVGSEVAKALKGLKTVSKDQLQAAVAKAKFEVASKSETSVGLVELVVPQVSRQQAKNVCFERSADTFFPFQIFSGKVATLEESYKTLDAITTESISKVSRSSVIRPAHSVGVTILTRLSSFHLDSRQLPQVQAYRRFRCPPEPDELRGQSQRSELVPRPSSRPY